MEYTIKGYLVNTIDEITGEQLSEPTTEIVQTCFAHTLDRAKEKSNKFLNDFSPYSDVETIIECYKDNELVEIITNSKLMNE
jgi:hypothetical protein